MTSLERGPFRVGMDARMLFAPRGSGVATYAANLRESIEMAGYAPVLLTDTRDGRPGSRPPPWGRLTRAMLPGPHRANHESSAGADGFSGRWMAEDIFRRAHLHMRIHRRPLRLHGDHPPEIMHWTYPVPMVFDGAANVYVVHDLIPLSRPDLTPIDGRRHRRTVRMLAAAADHIVTVSEASRRQVIDLLDCPEDRVTNTYQTVNVAGPAARPPAGLVPGGYFLFCGAVEPRKNLARLAAAHRTSGVREPLVIAGPDGWRADEVCRGLGLGERVVRLPWLERPHLLSLMANARALLMPSLAEGFGLPVAEAMALGVPVMTSNAGALAETAGDAAVLVDPLDVRAMAEAIAMLSRDAEARRGLAQRGLERAKSFTPEAHRRRLATVYQRVLDRRPPRAVR